MVLNYLYSAQDMIIIKKNRSISKQIVCWLIKFNQKFRIRFMIDWKPPNVCQQMCHTVILWYNIYVSKVMIQLLCNFLASTKKKHCFMTLYWLWTLTKCFPQKLKLKGALVNIIRYEEKKKSYPNYTHLGSNGFQLV